MPRRCGVTMAEGAKVWIEDKALMAFLKRAMEEVPGGRKGLRNKHVKKFNQFMLTDIGKRFRADGVNESGTRGVWPELAPSTKAVKRNMGRGSMPTLMRKGTLAHSIKIKVAKRGRYLVQDVPATKYYWFHHFGNTSEHTSKRGKRFKVVVPPRRLLLWTRPNQEQLKQHLLAWWAAVQKRTTV